MAQQRLQIVVAFDSLPPGESLTLFITGYECNRVASSLNSTLSARLHTSRCFDETACSVQLQSPTSFGACMAEPSCVPLDDEEFLPDAGAGAIGAEMADNSSLIVGIVVGSVICLAAIVCCLCCFFVSPVDADEEPLAAVRRQRPVETQRVPRVDTREEMAPIRRRTRDIPAPDIAVRVQR